MQNRIFQEWILFTFCWQISKQEIVVQRGFSCCLKRITFFSFKFYLFQNIQNSMSGVTKTTTQKCRMLILSQVMSNS